MTKSRAPRRPTIDEWNRAYSEGLGNNGVDPNSQLYRGLVRKFAIDNFGGSLRAVRLAVQQLTEGLSPRSSPGLPPNATPTQRLQELSGLLKDLGDTKLLPSEREGAEAIMGAFSAHLDAFRAVGIDPDEYSDVTLAALESGIAEGRAEITLPPVDAGAQLG